MSRTTKFFITAVAAVGLLAAAFTLAHAEWRSAQALQFILYVVLARPVIADEGRAPWVTGTLSVNFVFILLSAVELPRVDTLLISRAAMLAQCLWSTKAPGLAKIAFNLGNAALCGVFAVWSTDPPRSGREQQPSSIALLCLGQLFPAEHFDRRRNHRTDGKMKRTVQVWRENFLWTAPQYIFGAGLVGVIHICNRH